MRSLSRRLCRKYLAIVTAQPHQPFTHHLCSITSKYTEPSVIPKPLAVSVIREWDRQVHLQILSRHSYTIKLEDLPTISISPPSQHEEAITEPEDDALDLEEEARMVEELTRDMIFDDDSSPTYSLADHPELISVTDVVTVLEKMRGIHVQSVNVSDKCEWTDWMVVATGNSGRHVRGMAEAVVHAAKQRRTVQSDNELPTVEGSMSENWMVVDCGSVVVHLFDEESRELYDIEDLWRSGR